VLEAARKVAESEWDKVWITADQAAEALGVSVDEFKDNHARSIMCVDGEDFGAEPGLRFHRDWIDARLAGLLRPADWPV